VRRLIAIATALVSLTALFALTTAPIPAAAGTLAAKDAETLALQWFERMRTGQIDRTQLTGEYSAQLSDQMVQKTATYMTKYKFGATPTGAQVLRTRSVGEQTFYDVKLIFPRGDAASILFSLDRDGKITGIALMSMAGD